MLQNPTYLGFEITTQNATQMDSFSGKQSQSPFHLICPRCSYLMKVDMTSDDLDRTELLLDELSDKRAERGRTLDGIQLLKSCKTRFANFCPTKAYRKGFKQQCVYARETVRTFASFRLESTSQSLLRYPPSFFRNSKTR